MGARTKMGGDGPVVGFKILETGSFAAKKMETVDD